MKRISSIKRTVFAGLTALTLALVNIPPAVAAELQLTDAPLFIDLAVEPNVVVTLDDSGSMKRCYVIDKAVSESSVQNKSGMTASAVNALAYNPNIAYVVPVDDNGVTLGNPDFNDAWEDGYASNRSSNKKVLNSDFEPCWSPLTDYRSNPISAESAYYHTFAGDPKSNSSVNDQSNYTKVAIGAAEEQNFANWFSYYRNRLLTMKSAAGRAFTDPALTGRIRLGYTAMWGYQGEDKDKMGPISLMKKYEGVGRTEFLTWLYATQNQGGTPLPKAMNRAGHYYMDEDPDGSQSTNWLAMNPVDSPWAFEPGVTKDPEFTCRQAFQVFMTDGSWNSKEERMGVVGNIDNTAVAYPEALDAAATMTDYTPYAPYKDTNTITLGGTKYGYLADNAFYYWVTDLRPDLANDVAAYMPDPTAHPTTGNVEDNPKNDPATWQHMVNFTVGFGVDGALVYPGDYDGLLADTKDWNFGDKVDDLWHAAINSRGQYLSAKNPDDLVNAFGSALDAVLARTSSGAAVALSSGSLEAGSRLFQGRFNSGTWTGQVLAFDLNTSTGAAASSESWDAAPLLTARVQGGGGSGWDTNREVITFDGTNGIPFRWTSLTSGMQADLNTDNKGVNDGQGLERLQYLRGSEANEGANGNGYRARASKLGDIINSAPVYVGDPSFNYPDNLEASKYSTFKTSVNGRTPMVYVGANDGMLHGLDATSGEEKIAYVPNEVFANLTRLTATDYAHRFFVDGAPTVGDVFYSGAWHTVLVGGLRKGGQGLYALDITDPASFDEVNASSLVLWEFTDADDADLGYTYSRPAIVRMANGTWAAVFGNGYNNTEVDGNASFTGPAVLYIVDISNGNLIKKIDTKAGSATTPNGLAGVAPVDVDGDRTIDYIYAGDLLGNLWKFDVSSSNAAQWQVAHKSGATPLPLYVAKDKYGVPQPITAQPEVGAHPKNTTSGVLGNGGYMVYFGTGKYIESGDNTTSSTQTQTFYGVWDPDETSLPPGFDRSNLLQQKILNEVSALGADLRITSDNTISYRPDPMTSSAGDHLGWYMDLINLGGSPVANSGERQVTTPALRGGRIIFTTLIPSGSSCVFGGDGWLMELDATDGSRLDAAPFDLDGDGVFDTVDDGMGTQVAPGGIKSTGGAPSSPGILTDAANSGQEYKYISGTDQGGIQAVSEQGDPTPPGGNARQSWRQLR